MTVIKVAESLGRMFYLVSPKATTFGTEQEVPPYVADATPWFIFFIIAELLYFSFKDKGRGLKRHDGQWSQGKYRMNDMIGSLGAGSIQQMSRFFLGSLQMVTYNYIWDHYRIESIAFDTFKLWTWIGCFLGVGNEQHMVAQTFWSCLTSCRYPNTLLFTFLLCFQDFAYYWVR